MVTTLSGIVMEGRAEQFRKAPLPIDTTPLPIETEESSTQSPKALFPILSTLAGITIDASPLQLPKADSPIETRLLPRATEFRLVQL